MSGAKRKGSDMVRRAFGAAISDLTPGGRLPKGFSEEKATRACLAFAAVNLERFAVAGEKMREILEDTEPEPEGGWQDEPSPAPGSAEAMAEFQHPGMPQIPAGQMDPQKLASLIEEQDQETCRKFAIVFLRWMDEFDGGSDHWTRDAIKDLARDLEAQECGAMERVQHCYRKALELDADGDPFPPVPGPGIHTVPDDDEGDAEDVAQSEGSEPPVGARRCPVCHELPENKQADTCGREQCKRLWAEAQEGGTDGGEE